MIKLGQGRLIMKNNRLNLIYKLNHIVNQNQVGTVEYELAKFFLDNFKIIKKQNIYDIAEKNHVSRTSIRRFAKQIGYENFADMKKHIEDFDDGQTRFEDFYGQENFLPILMNNIENLMAELGRRMNTQEIDRLIDMMNHKNEIVIISSSNIAGIVKTFQLQMIVFQKRVTLITTREDLEIYKQSDKQPLIIVFSISGLFASTILSDLELINGEKVLFTIQRNPVFNQVFNKIYHLCGQDFDAVSDLLYYTYGITFVFDILFNGFIRQQKESEKNAL